MGPAQEGLHGDHLARLKIDLRLVVQCEGSLGHSQTEVLDESEAVGFVVEGGVVDVE